ncbi:MAG: c-type cytochrome [Acidobacteria bacterium]|nr:c-type cytochrome [Acidobacteriota bacterium]
MPFAAAQDAANFFEESCAVCHTIGSGPLAGPDLKDVSKRKDRAWLERFLLDPEAVLNSEDSYALKLQEEYNGMVMPAISGLTPQMATALLDMIDAKSQVAIADAPSDDPANGVVEQPFTPDDVAAGIALFQGTQKLRGGGAACIACHTMGTLQALGGGKLGPDLTLAYSRLGGRKAATAWLSSPPTPTMRAIFKTSALQTEEIRPLLAALEDAGNSPENAGKRTQIYFIFYGLLGACLVLLGMGLAWRSRFRNVRRNLVSHSRGAA